MIRATIADLQIIYSERDPYSEETRLDNAGLVVFDPIFIELVILAFSTDCVAQMSEDEIDLLYKFIDYENGTYDDKYVQALDIWLSNLVNSIENPTLEGCA
ncbi:MAG: hypothetical protein AB7D34_01225 [Sulfurimonas sp.]